MKVLVNGVELELTKAQARKLGLAEKPEPIESAPELSKAAQATIALAEMGYVSSNTNPFGRVNCAYGACDETFAPNGDGPWYHGKCDVGSQLFGKFQKAYKADGGAKGEAYAKVLADAKALADRLS